MNYEDWNLMTPRERAAWRIKFIKTLPFVQFVTAKDILNNSQCEAYRSMSIKARRNPLLKEKYRCKNTIRYKFTALQKSYADSGRYCGTHLWSSGLSCDELERDRTNKYWEKFMSDNATISV